MLPAVCSSGSPPLCAKPRTLAYWCRSDIGDHGSVSFKTSSAPVICKISGSNSVTWGILRALSTVAARALARALSWWDMELSAAIADHLAPVRSFSSASQRTAL